MTTLARTHVAARRNVPPFDLILVTATLLVSMIGVVMVYTATRGSLLAQGDDPKTFLKKQGLFVVLGFITMVVLAVIDYRRSTPIAKIFYWLIVLSLIGRVRGREQCSGCRPLVQPGPAAAPAIGVRGAGTHFGRGDVLRAARGRGPGLARRLPSPDHVGIPIVLVLVQPDLGTAMIMVIVLLVLLAVAGLPVRILFMLLVGTALVAFVAVEGGLLHHYQIARLTTFLNPNSHSTNPFVQEAIYNGQQAKNAIGSGGLFGSGIGHGVADESRLRAGAADRLHLHRCR